MKCREFKSKHVGFIDDLLSAWDMAEMRQHVRECAPCATLDVRIRRSLLVIRNLPEIEPAADFYLRLCDQLRTAPRPSEKQRTSSVAKTIVVVTAALAAALYFAMAVQLPHRNGIQPSPTQNIAARPQTSVDPMSDVTLAAAVPAGVPVWPAMFMVGELPMHLANVELVDNTIGR